VGLGGMPRRRRHLQRPQRRPPAWFVVMAA
jgi:hypothetical protein